MTDPGFPYRLGLDLGTNSIGWAVLELDDGNKPTRVDKLGSRIFTNGRDPKTGASLAVKRREARGLRRGFQRTSRRKQKLHNALTRIGLLPVEQKQLNVLLNTNAYKLRSTGLHEAISFHQLGRVIYHLNQHRGYKSNRKDANENEGGVILQAISQTERDMREQGYKTLGDYLYRGRIEKGLSPKFAYHKVDTKKSEQVEISNADEDLYNLFPTRQMLSDEFNILWNRQRQLHAGDADVAMLSEENREQLHDILFHQRPLKPQNPGTCNFFNTVSNSKLRGPLASPTIQRRQLLDRVNNLRLVPADNLYAKGEPLSVEDRDLVLAYMYGIVNKKRKATSVRALKAVKYEDLRKLLLTEAHEDYRFTHEDVDKSGGGELKGDATAHVLSNPKLLGGAWYELALSGQERVVDLLLDEMLDEDVLLSKLGVMLAELNLDQDDDTLSAVLYAALPTGYSKSESVLAAGVIVEYLEARVISFTEAIIAARVEGRLPHSTGTSTLYDKLPYYGEVLAAYTAPVLPGATTNAQELKYGRIGNPTVHVALNQVRAVVNDIIAHYGHKPEQIVVELTRDLKNNLEQRREIQDRQNKQAKQNEDLAKKLAELGVVNNRANRDKLSLYQELLPGGSRCPYTGRVISESMVFAADSPVEVEHILPYSRTFDDGINNKTLTFRQANQYKGNRSPHEAWGADPERWALIQQQITTLPKAKQGKFGPSAMDRFDKHEGGFQQRQLTDTAYISKLARIYLNVLYNEDQEHQHTWAVPGRLTGMLRARWGLNSILAAPGQDTKNRGDHRHHAIDAAVVAFTDRALLQRISERSSRKEQAGDRWQRHEDTFPEPIENLYSLMIEAVDAITVSHKLDHGVQGQLHRESSQSIVAETANVSAGAALERAFPVVEGEQAPRTSTFVVVRGEDGVVTGAYSPYSNYCFEVSLADDATPEKPKWHVEVVRTFTANSKEYQAFMRSKRYTATTFSNRPLVIRLRKTDIIKLSRSSKYFAVGLYLVKALTYKESGAGRFEVALTGLSNDTDSGSSAINQFMLLEPKAVRVSPMGRVLS